MKQQKNAEQSFRREVAKRQWPFLGNNFGSFLRKGAADEYVLLLEI